MSVPPKRSPRPPAKRAAATTPVMSRQPASASTKSTKTAKPAAAKPIKSAAAKPIKSAAAVADYKGAWRIDKPEAETWTARPWVPPAERHAEGRAERKRVPRTSHAEFQPQRGRDPIAILQGQESDRLQALIPLRHGRMAESPFAYYRGTPAVMAYDLSTTPSTEMMVQASGDAHLSNFGIYASPERHIVFDANDFDETFPAPWEWDIKRLATSVVVASRANGFTPAQARQSTMYTVKTYRQWMARYAGMSLLEVWYSGLSEDSINKALETEFAGDSGLAAGRARLDAYFAKARGRDTIKAASKLTQIVDGHMVFTDDPPVIQHVELPGGEKGLADAFDGYRATMPESLRDFLERYRFADVALKVVGVGSVGTRCFVMALEGRDDQDPLILQAKEATTSVLEPFTKGRKYSNQGERVVHGQRLMQATSDIFLGWSRGPGGRDFYFRQLWDMKASVDTATLRPPGMSFYGGLCGWAIAAAHARTGDAVAISAYLGTSDTFDGAIADFAETYADKNEADHKAFREAISSGRITAETG